MAETRRKKSTSSDSELSDGWSLVEHSDTVLLTLTHQNLSHSSLLGLESSRSTGTGTGAAGSTVECETSSDAESVDIIQEDTGTTDFHLHHHSLTMITNHKLDKEKCLEGGYVETGEKHHREANITEPEVWSIINSSHYPSEWCRLIIFTSSLVALLLLLVSYGSLFFKEQNYAKSDSMILLPDEDLSSLISDLAIFKEENSRLKAELNMIKYEYGNTMKLDKEESPSDEQSIQLELIPDEIFTEGSVAENHLPPSASKVPHQPPSHHFKTDKLNDLMTLERRLKTFAENIGLTKLMVSSYNISKNLNSINVILKRLNDVIDRQESSKRDNKKQQLEQKLTKLINHIEQDLKKSLEKVVKRINKFYSNSLDAFCRLNGGSSDTDHIDCSGFSKHEEIKKKKEQIKRDEKLSVIKPSKETGNTGKGGEESSNESVEDSQLNNRHKRSSDDSGKHKEYSDLHLSKKDDIGSPLKMKQQKNYKNSDKAFSYSDYFDDSNVDNGNTASKFDNNDNKRKINPSLRNKDKKKLKQEKKEDLKGNDGGELRDGIRSTIQKDNSKGDSKKRVISEGKSKCSQKKNCMEKKHGKQQKDDIMSESKLYEQFEKDKSPSRTWNIHNESMYGRINGVKRSKMSGQWYLDIGETRRQRRAYRRESLSNGWLFDRALVRDWCRTNSDSSLCASFGHLCDYCA